MGMKDLITEQNDEVRRLLWSRASLTGVKPMPALLVAEWQERGPATLSGRTLRKLRLAFDTRESAITAAVAA